MNTALVLAGDDRFLPGLLVALWSLRERAGWGPSTHDLHLYELGDGITDKRRVEDVWRPIWHRLDELPDLRYAVEQTRINAAFARLKLGLLGTPLAQRCVWIDADVVALGELPLLERDGWALPLDRGIAGQIMNGATPARSTGAMRYTPDPGLPRQLEAYSRDNPRPYRWGDQELLSWYISDGHLRADVLPFSHHLNVRWGQDQDARGAYLVERHGTRLLHWGGPKPWIAPRDCSEVVTWLDAARLAGVQVS